METVTVNRTMQLSTTATGQIAQLRTDLTTAQTELTQAQADLAFAQNALAAIPDPAGAAAAPAAPTFALGTATVTTSIIDYSTPAGIKLLKSGVII